MPAQPLKAGRKLAYLDWSTLVYAHEGALIGARQDLRRLHDLVWRISDRLNLCLSHTHIWELAQRSRRASRRAMAEWLDSLPVSWFPDEDAIHAFELRSALARALRSGAGISVPPLTGSLLAGLAAWPFAGGPALSYALSRNSLAELVDDLASDGSLTQRLQGLRELGRSGAVRLYEDRRAAMNEVSPEVIETTLVARLRQRRIDEAIEALAALRVADPQSLCVERNGILVVPEVQEVRSLLASNLRLEWLPYTFLSHQAVRGTATSILDRPSTTSKTWDDHLSDAFDHLHLVGGAYCDIFTCDRATARRLGGGRECLGLAPPITAEGGVGELTRRLEEALENSAGGEAGAT